jgi:recombination protein RecT
MSEALSTRPSSAPPAAIAKRDPLDKLKNLFEAARPSMLAVIPKHLTPERLIKVALVAVSKTPALMAADPMTVVQSVMTAAQLGLDPAGVLGSAYLVPFRNRKTGNAECQLIVGYRGLIDLARRSGQIDSIEARPVFENDAFEVSFGTDTYIKHRPCLDGDPGALRFVYAVARLKDTALPVVELMTRAQIEKIRRRSKSGDDGPWVNDYEEMARKTVVRRISKYLPLSTELATALELSGVADDRGTGDIMALPMNLSPTPAASVTLEAAGPAGEVITATVVEVPEDGPEDAPEAPSPAPGPTPDPTPAAPTARARKIAEKARQAAVANGTLL